MNRFLWQTYECGGSVYSVSSGYGGTPWGDSHRTAHKKAMSLTATDPVEVERESLNARPKELLLLRSRKNHVELQMCNFFHFSQCICKWTVSYPPKLKTCHVPDRVTAPLLCVSVASLFDLPPPSSSPRLLCRRPEKFLKCGH